MGIEEMHLITIPIPFGQMVKCIQLESAESKLRFYKIKSKKETKSSRIGKTLESLFFRKFCIQPPCIKWKGISLFIQIFSMMLRKLAEAVFGRGKECGS